MAKIIAIILALMAMLISLNFIGGALGVFVILFLSAVINIFEPAKQNNGIIFSSVCGFIWDLYSFNGCFGLYFIGLTIASALVKLAVIRVIHVPEGGK
jgi:cell shape-determining protein MreD